MDKYRIGVDAPSFDSVNEKMLLFRITVLKGLDIKANICYEDLESFDDIFPFLVFLCEKYNAKIMYDNSVKYLYTLFEKNDKLDLLDYLNISDPEIKRLNNTVGMPVLSVFKTCFDKYKYFIRGYNGTNEYSTMLASLPLLVSKEFRIKYKEVDKQYQKFHELNKDTGWDTKSMFEHLIKNGLIKI